MQVYIGIDWSEEKHDIVFMNQAGADLATMRIPHRLEGFAQFDATRHKLGLAPQDCLVGLETAHSLLVDYLWSRDYQNLYVLPPKQVHDNQGRFRQSGAKDDPADARLIADILRTDRGRLPVWRPDSLLTRQIRAQVSWILQLTTQVTRLSNRLRAVLLRYYPAAVGVFSSGLTTQIAPEFVRAYPNPQAAKDLSWTEFQKFAKQHRYSHPGELAKCFARLQVDFPETSPDTVLIFQDQALQLAGLLLETTRTKLHNLRQLQDLYRQHPKYPVFASLPGAGDLIGPALLAKFGDDPQRYPHPSVVQALAGTSPVTKRSGKHKSVQFRYSCDKEWRHICQQWASVLVNQAQSPIAVAYYQQIRPHCHSNAHAYRCVAHRWLAVAWKLWQTGQAYDASYHFEQRALRSFPHRN
jgi:transposase